MKQGQHVGSVTDERAQAAFNYALSLDANHASARQHMQELEAERERLQNQATATSAERLRPLPRQFLPNIDIGGDRQSGDGFIR